MYLKKITSSYAAYNVWACDQLVKWLDTLPVAMRNQETTSSFKTIDRTVQHMIHAQNFWIASLSEKDNLHLDESYRKDQWDNIMKDLSNGAKTIRQMADDYSEAELLHGIIPDPTIHNIPHTRYEYLMHVINHNTHHRGQLMTIARMLGYAGSIPTMDYDVYISIG